MGRSKSPLLVAAVAIACTSGRPAAPREPPDLAGFARAALRHAWDGYRAHAWGHDELRPVSKTARDWTAAPLWITPVDALDSLILLGLSREADEARAAIDANLSFDQDVEVKNFEIVIRVLGGLLSSYQLSGDPKLLALADDLGRRLLPVFDSPTGMPYVNVNLRTGKASGAKSNPAEIGSLLLEFGTLARLTGKDVYYAKAKRALTELFARRSPAGLVADEIDVETGRWLSRESHIGGGIDSYYEVLWKAWLLFGDEDCRRMWEASIGPVNRFVADDRPSGLWYGVVDFETGARLRPEYGALEAFFAGTLALAGDLDRARRLADSNFRMWTSARTEPDAFDYHTLRPIHPRWPLRPEIVESAYYLAALTGEQRWAGMGRRFAADIDACCRVEAGYTVLDDVTTGKQGDLMPSYFLAETLKYLWLLGEPQAVDLREVVFNTEAHPLKRVPPGTGSGPIDPARLSDIVKTLASDAFEGRAPGSAGEEKTVAFLIERFQQLGLAPAGENGEWTQAVPLVHTQVQPGAVITIEAGAGKRALVQGEDVYLSTVQPRARARIASLPIVFVGYGVTAPERHWDDYKDVDLHGKVALYLVNDPDFEAQPGEAVAGQFGGKAMTYYGRWTYKYEEAARRGAAAAIIVHETPGAGYGWVTVAAPHGENFDVAGAPARVPLQGWLQRAVAVELFEKAGLDLEQLKRKARDASFHPIELPGVRLSADLAVTHSLVRSRNVLARIPGASRPGESVMFSAHWDAYGPAPGASGPNQIRRGAADDAIGVAGLFELARAFKDASTPPARSVIFGVWTAEERGLLGSEYFGAHPTVPLAKMAANYTMDILQTAGPARDVVLVGAGQNSLEQGLARAAAAQGRTVTPDSRPERGLFYRADHFSLARRGVPVLLLMGIGGGADLVEGGRAAGDKWVGDYTARCYHQTCDSWSATWDLRGAARDVELLYRAGSDLASSTQWPVWNDGSEFKALREKSAAERSPTAR